MGLTHIDNGQILYDGMKMELFVPEDYFKAKLAEETGTNYSIFGAVKAIHYSSQEQTRKEGKHSFLYFPGKFTTSPEIVTSEKIDFGDGEEKYRVFTYFKNSVLFTNSMLIQSIDNVEYFVDLLMNGKLDIVKYNKIPNLIALCKYYNGITFNCPAMYEEVIVSDYYRDPNNVKRPARFAAVNEDYDFYAKGISQRNKVSYMSTFSGLSYEDVNSMLTLADNVKREGKTEIINDVEAISIDREKGDESKNG